MAAAQHPQPAQRDPIRAEPGAMGPYAVELQGICKRFGAVQANDDVSLQVRRGSVHALIGENGAGKSTCMSILYGYYRADAGQLRRDGRPVTIRHSQDAIALGIGMVHQHFMLVDRFTVLENVVLGIEGGLRLAGGLARARERLAALNAQYGLAVDADAVVGTLPLGLRQRVEILKALYREAQVLILDEPTAVLTPQEADELFRILHTLREQGKTTLLITHKLREVLAVSDRVTVMRGGRVVAEVDTADTNADALATLMVGRAVDFRVQRRPAVPGPVVLAVQGIGLRGAHGQRLLQDLGFEVRAGEIVGIAGVSGNGQSELLEVLAGLRRPDAGRFTVHGIDPHAAAGREPVPRRVRALGVGHVPEDRLADGVVRSFSLAENAVLGRQRDSALRRVGLLSRRRLHDAGRRLLQAFDVRPADPALRVSLLSGGNQQKLVLARELEADPALLLVGQPTRGVDVGAIEFIHRRLAALRDAGKAILLVSVELDEILALSDRILVMCGGRITGELAAGQADARQLGRLMGGQAA